MTTVRDSNTTYCQRCGQAPPYGVDPIAFYSRVTQVVLLSEYIRDRDRLLLWFGSYTCRTANRGSELTSVTLLAADGRYAPGFLVRPSVITGPHQRPFCWCSIVRLSMLMTPLPLSCSNLSHTPQRWFSFWKT